MKLKLKSVACTCPDRGAGRLCRDDVMIAGDDWDPPQTLHDRPFLLKAFMAEGYEIDASEYQDSLTGLTPK